MSTRTHDFAPGDRYRYDFSVCTYEKGWAQLDTSQDASYYGTWINPTERKIFNYCEGDCYLTQCDSDAELIAEVERIKQWNLSQGHRFLGIDYGLYEDGPVAVALRAAGLAPYFHGWDAGEVAA